nr:putative transposase [Enterobacter sp.]
MTVCSLKLPLVIPVLFCTGQRSPIRWPDKFDDPALAGKLYSDASPLIDVTVIPDDEIAGHRSIAALTLLQKYIHQQDLAELFDRLAPILLAGYLSSSLVLYVVQAGETSGAQAFVRELTQRVPQHGYALMFIAQQLEQKGIEKGIQLGGNGLRIMYRKVLVHIVIRDCRQ